MRIAFLTRSLISCGAERQLVELAKGLCRRGHDVSVIVFYPQCQLADELREMGIRVWILNKRGRWDILHFIANLIEVLRIEEADVLHGYIGTPNMFAALIKPFFPKMKIIWGMRSSANEVAVQEAVQPFLRIAETCLSYCVDLIIVNSLAGLNYLKQRHFPEKKIVMISNGIDSDRFCCEPSARQKIRREWEIEEKQILIGLIGRLRPEKGHKVFLKAAAFLLMQRRDVRFVCVGDGDPHYRQELNNLASFLGIHEQVAFVPSRPDINCVYNALDILVSASYWEGFSNVIGEAMASGVPCVVTDVGDSARIVGNTGIVVPPDNPEAMAKALKDMISLLAENKIQLTQETRQRIVEQFGTESLVDTTLKTLLMLT